MKKKILRLIILFLVGIPVFFVDIVIIETVGELLIKAGKFSRAAQEKMSSWAFGI